MVRSKDLALFDTLKKQCFIKAEGIVSDESRLSLKTTRGCMYSIRRQGITGESAKENSVINIGNLPLRPDLNEVNYIFF